MRKAIKIFFVSTASVLVILIIAICIALWFVFTPEKLTPIVRNQAVKYITCKSEIGEVELTFFSTFPNFGLKVNQFMLINPTTGAPNDTLIGINEMVAIVDLAAWWKRDEIKINELILRNGTFNIFTDSAGQTNYDIFPADTLAPQVTETKPIVAELENLNFDNINLTYVDLSMKLKTTIHNLTAVMNGSVNSGVISSTVSVSKSIVSLVYDNEIYLNNVATSLDMRSEISFPKMKVLIKEASGSLNELPITVSGLFANDTLTNDLLFDIKYTVASSPISQLMKMIPLSYMSYFEGIAAEGQLAVDGKINGTYTDSTMPLFDVHLLMENGTINYEGFPLTMNEVSGDITIRTDGMTDALTFVRIDRFSAKTPKSSFNTKGTVNQLFSDIYCDLTTDANLTLEEFNSMVPADMKLAMKGNAQGQVKSAFSMVQIEKMQIEKMKLSGSVALTNFDVAYDSMLLKSDHSEVSFALPNTKPSAKNCRFAYVDINSKNLAAGMLDSYNTNLQQAKVVLEISDMRDTTRIPDILCSFSMDSLFAGKDTLTIAITKPQGEITVSPRPDQPDQPHIRLTGKTKRMETCVGQNTATMKSLSFDTDIVNHNEQKDIFLQWLVKGFFDLEQGKISMTGLTYPLEIPAIKMNFTPETLNIKEGNLKIDKSDFHLSGSLTNILSYFRNDSILRGSFNFTSGTTDVSQLMALTSGIGSEEEKPDSTVADTTYSGPYMVPKGIDITLNANIGQAFFGNETATNISGEVRVYDGILILEDVNLTTPAARMQLTSIYRTPRKNHLYLGLDYHMFDVEIEQLLQMIPDIDSLMPMLRSFRGKGEFHLAIETYLDSMYNLKKSTLRGASSIKGQDLVLMDGETFSEIAKKLMFNKKTENRVDSLSAEFTIFRDEIDIYPFLIVMDKYKAVIAGRHNFDLSFDYHISVVECPLPLKLGIDIKGTMDNMDYSLAKCKYAEFYRPTSRKVVENKQLELRKLIREALTRRVKTDDNN